MHAINMSKCQNVKKRKTLKESNNVLYTKTKRHRHLPKESRVHKLMFTHLKATDYLSKD